MLETLVWHPLARRSAKKRSIPAADCSASTSRPSACSQRLRCAIMLI